MRRLRPILRTVVPFAVRWRLRLARRLINDRQHHIAFANKRDPAEAFTHEVAAYARPLLCYPGQEARFAGKRTNIALALERIDGTVIAPGETFSFWRAVGRPTRAAGFLPAAALKNRKLTEETGGALCLASTLLYNVALLSGMTIVERQCHSVDTYGARRYFELGRDASVEFAYIDLRFRNDSNVSLIMHASAGDRTVEARICAKDATSLCVEICVSPPEYMTPPTSTVPDATLSPDERMIDDDGQCGMRIRTRRIVRSRAGCHVDDLGWSVHHAVPRRERLGV